MRNLLPGQQVHAATTMDLQSNSMRSTDPFLYNYQHKPYSRRDNITFQAFDTPVRSNTVATNPLNQRVKIQDKHHHGKQFASRCIPNKTGITTPERYHGPKHMPQSFAPSRPLSLLLEPANLDLWAHEQAAEHSYLYHYNWSMETEGRKSMRLKEEEDARTRKFRRRRGDRNTKRLTAKREHLSLETKAKAVGATIIDLTGDD
jgi:hypothetical protein